MFADAYGLTIDDHIVDTVIERQLYNPARRHSALGYLTRNELEDLHSAKTPATSS